jgi:hypothetical protein
VLRCQADIVVAEVHKKRLCLKGCRADLIRIAEEGVEWKYSGVTNLAETPCACSIAYACTGSEKPGSKLCNKKFCTETIGEMFGKTLKVKANANITSEKQCSAFIAAIQLDGSKMPKKKAEEDKTLKLAVETTTSMMISTTKATETITTKPPAKKDYKNLKSGAGTGHVKKQVKKMKSSAGEKKLKDAKKSKGSKSLPKPLKSSVAKDKKEMILKSGAPQNKKTKSSPPPTKPNKLKAANHNKQKSAAPNKG